MIRAQEELGDLTTLARPCDRLNQLVCVGLATAPFLLFLNWTTCLGLSILDGNLWHLCAELSQHQCCDVIVALETHASELLPAVGDHGD